MTTSVTRCSCTCSGGCSGSSATAEAMKAAGISVDDPLWAHMHAGDCTAGDGDQGCRCGPCNYCKQS